MTNPFTAFYDNVKDKTTNPFFGTLILVWLFRNWELLYTIFNFDSNYKLEGKKAFIKEYFASRSFLQELAINVTVALALMLLGYFLIIITRVIINVVDHRIIPNLNQRTVSRLVINKSAYDDVKRQRDIFRDEVDVERGKLIKVEEDNSNLRKLNTEYAMELQSYKAANDKSLKYKQQTDKKINELSLKLEDSMIRESELQDEINKLKHQIYENVMLKALQHQLLTENQIPYDVTEAYHYLATHDSEIAFYYMVNEISTGKEAQFNPDYLDKFEELKLFSIDKSVALDSNENNYMTRQLSIHPKANSLVHFRRILETEHRQMMLEIKKHKEIIKA